MASAAVRVSVKPALADLAATPNTSSALAGAMEADRMSYKPPDSASVDSPKLTAILRMPLVKPSMYFSASESESMVATVAICC